ncbi:MAG TPA: short-chain dehydrogenase, partial [Alphaproteobacteria bacterium]|nr:short-chain dehydrogenase [Alphaproteobacteria bacterium]
AAYGPTKAAIQNLAEALYFDLHPKGVKLQLINPGFVETEATAINDFTMPDLITSDAAAMYIINGLKRDEFEISFPKSFVRKMKFMRLLPVSTYLRLTAKLTGHR